MKPLAFETQKRSDFTWVDFNFFPVQVHKRAGGYSSCHRSRGGIHPAQSVAGLTHRDRAPVNPRRHVENIQTPKSPSTGFKLNEAAMVTKVLSNSNNLHPISCHSRYYNEIGGNNQKSVQCSTVKQLSCVYPKM